MDDLDNKFDYLVISSKYMNVLDKNWNDDKIKALSVDVRNIRSLHM